jgi:hypothetical protein
MSDNSIEKGELFMIYGYFTPSQSFPPWDNESISRGTFEVARRLIVQKRSFIALFSLVMLVLLGCVQPVAIRKSTPDEIMEEKSNMSVYTTKDGQMWLQVGISSGASRSITNYTSLDDGLRKGINYYQLILLEEEQNEISGFSDWLQIGDETQLKGTAEEGELLVPVSLNKTYHMLLLMGHKDDANDKKPILLASGYRKETISKDSSIIFTMIPLFVDMKFIVEGQSAPSEPKGDSVEVSKGKSFDVQVTLFGKVSGTSGSGDGLWPLKLAEQLLREDSAWWDAIETQYRDFKGGSVTTGDAPQNMDDQIVTLQSNKGTFTNGGNLIDEKDGKTPSLNINYTGDSLTYAYDGQPSFNNAFFNFELEYIPFSLNDASVWPTPLTEAPLWLICNWQGLPKNPDGTIPDTNSVPVKEPGGGFGYEGVYQ